MCIQYDVRESKYDKHEKMDFVVFVVAAFSFSRAQQSTYEDTSTCKYTIAIIDTI